MPTYEYVCSACGHEFEAFQSITADPIRLCPRCGKRKVARKIGIGGAVIFRGGGFYETDYRSADYEQAKKADGVPAAAATTGAAASKDATAGNGAVDAAGTKDSPAGAKAAPTSGSTEATQRTKPDASERTSGESTVPSEARDASERKGASSRGKNHAREGRGVGNVLQLGRTNATKSSATKSSTTKSSTTKSSPSSKPARPSTGKRKSKGR